MGYKVLVAFTKDASTYDKKRQLDFLKEDGWDIYEVNGYKNLDYIEAFAEEAKKVNASNFAVLNDNSDIDFSKKISECCKPYFENIQLIPEAFLRLSEADSIPLQNQNNMTQAQQNTTQTQQNTILNGQQNINSFGNMSQESGIISTICIGLLINIEACVNFSKINKMLTTVSNFITSNKDAFKQIICKEYSDYSKLQLSDRLTIEYKVFIAENDIQKSGLCQPIAIESFLSMIYKDYDPNYPNKFAGTNSSSYNTHETINMKNPKSFITGSNRSINGRTIYLLYSLNNNDNGAYTQGILSLNQDRKSSIIVLNDNVHNVSFGNTLNLFNRYCAGANYFSLSEIAKANTNFMQIAVKIAKHVNDKNYKIQNKIIDMDSTLFESHVMPVAKLIVSYSKFGNTAQQKIYDWNQAETDDMLSKEGRLSKEMDLIKDLTKHAMQKSGIGAFADDVTNSKFFKYFDHREEERKALLRAKKAGFNDSNLMAAYLDENFPAAFNMIFPEIKIIYKEAK